MCCIRAACGVAVPAASCKAPRLTCGALTPLSSPVPVPNGIIGTRCWWQTRATALTCSTLPGNTTAIKREGKGETDRDGERGRGKRTSQEAQCTRTNVWSEPEQASTSLGQAQEWGENVASKTTTTSHMHKCTHAHAYVGTYARSLDPSLDLSLNLSLALLFLLTTSLHVCQHHQGCAGARRTERLLLSRAWRHLV